MSLVIEFYHPQNHGSWEKALDAGGVYTSVVHMASELSTAGKAIIEDCLEAVANALYCVNGEHIKLVARVRHEDRGVYYDPRTWEEIPTTLTHKQRFIGHLLYQHYDNLTWLYDRYKTVYKNAIKDTDETIMAYIKRCAEQDYDDGSRGASVFQEIWDLTR